MIRIATIGTSGITERFIRAVGAVDGVEVAVAVSRDRGRAEEFAARTGVPDAADSLTDVAGRAEAVYIGSPNGLHHAQALAAIDAGVHVFLEKPATPTADGFAELVDAAAARGVVVFEGMRNVYDPGFARMRELLPRVGTVRRASFSLCQRSARYDLVLRGETPNIFDPALAGGALYDLGVYPLSAAVALFGEPDAATGALVPIATGADGAGTALLAYPGMVVDIGFSKITASARPNEVQGELGTLTIDRVDQPRVLTFTAHGSAPVVEHVVGADDNMVHELERFAQLVRGEADPASDHARTLAVLRTVDGIRASF